MKFKIHFEFRASLIKFQNLNFWDATVLVVCACVVAATLALVCVSIPPLLLFSFEITCVRRERLQLVEIPHNEILLGKMRTVVFKLIFGLLERG
jgi:hypothetical protein